MKQILEVLNYRLDAETNYQHSLERIGNSQVSELCEGYYLGEEFKAIKQDCNLKAEAAKKYCDFLKTNAILPFKALLQKQREENNKWKSQFNSAQKTFFFHRENFEKQKCLFLEKCQEVEDVGAAYASSQEKNEEKKPKMLNHYMQTIKSCKENEAINKDYADKVQTARISFIRESVSLNKSIK